MRAHSAQPSSTPAPDTPPPKNHQYTTRYHRSLSLLLGRSARSHLIRVILLNFAEMKKFNTLVNINGLLRALKDLNTQLASARTSEEKLMTTLAFSASVAKYNI